MTHRLLAWCEEPNQKEEAYSSPTQDRLKGDDHGLQRQQNRELVNQQEPDLRNEYRRAEVDQKA